MIPALIRTILLAVLLCAAVAPASTLSAAPADFASAGASDDVTPLPDGIRFLALGDRSDTGGDGEGGAGADGEGGVSWSDSGSNAEYLFSFAMGESTGSCLTCELIGYFMTSMIKFSAVIYDFFAAAFPMIVPLLMLIWIAYRVIKLVTFGGEDGLTFIKEMAMKMALFAIVFTALTGTPDRWVWRMTGPEYLEFALDLSSAIRTGAFNATDLLPGEGAASAGGEGGSVPLRCENVKPTADLDALEGDLAFVQTGLEMTCFTERSHIIGIATGVAIIFAADIPNGNDNAGFISTLFTGLFRLICGIMVTAVFAMSCVWMIFLMLDVVVEIALISACSPLLAAAALWKPTRGIAVKGLKTIGGSLVTAVAITIVTVLAYFLMSNVVDIYNAMHGTVAQHFSGLTMTDIPVGDRGTEARISAMREFIARTQEVDADNPSIPMTFATPWFVYLCLVGIATFALGKKIITMIGQIMGMGGGGALADNALKMGVTATKTAAMAGGAMFAASGAALMSGGGAALNGLSYATGAGSQAATRAAGGAAKMAGGKMMGGGGNMLDQATGAKNALTSGGGDD